MTAALLPCPFCGEAPEEGEHGLIKCLNPDCPTTVCVLIPNDRAAAIIAWNRRAPVPCPAPCETCKKFAYECLDTAEEDGAARERAAIVAWLLSDALAPGENPALLADRIEAGEHLPAKSAGKEPGT